MGSHLRVYTPGNPLSDSTLGRRCVLSQRGAVASVVDGILSVVVPRQYCLDMPRLCYGLRDEGITV